MVLRTALQSRFLFFAFASASFAPIGLPGYIRHADCGSAQKGTYKNDGNKP